MKLAMKSWRAVACMSCIVLSSCGGGGGGGGGSSSHGVRILHSAIDAAPADLTSSAQPGIVLQTAAYGDPAGYVAASKGQQDLTLSLRGGAQLTVSTAVASDDRLSLLLFE